MEKNIEEIMNEPKLGITKAIKDQLTNKELSVRGLAKEIGMKHPQIVRVTNCENYNIDTLLKILNSLDLEIVVRPKK
jgi:predicted XRE-type DNA-binding protein